MLKKILPILALIIFSACSGTREFGSFVIDVNTGKEFEEALILPDYKYFYFGAREYPQALLALKKKYSLETSLWSPLEATPGRLSELIANMQSKNNFSGLKGFRLFDEHGSEVGKWYSPLSLTTMLEILGSDKVKIYPPDSEDILFENIGRLPPQ